MGDNQFLGLPVVARSATTLAAEARERLASGTETNASLVPEDKNLPADWHDRLHGRGAPTRYTGAELRYVGMPVGGACCGQVYLGGDGRLWYWDVDNGPAAPGADFAGGTYARPRDPFSPFASGTVLRTEPDGGARSVDARGFSDVAFTGQYPLGRVDYRDPGCPVDVRLEAFSPFVPGEVDDSTLPVTVLAYTFTNTSPHPVRAELTRWSENPVCLRARSAQPIALSSEAVGAEGWHGVQFTAARETPPGSRPDVLVEDWEGGYGSWTVTSEAFGTRPVRVDEVPAYMLRFGDLHVRGTRFVTSHNFLAAGGNAAVADSYTGTLTSVPVPVSRRYLGALVGGGNLPGRTCLNVLVDGEVVGSLTGDDTEPLRPRYVDLIRHQGRTATIQIVDSATGAWGHVNVDDIVLTDIPAPVTPIDQLTDGGTAAVVAFEPDAVVRPSLADWGDPTAVAGSGPGPVSVDGGLGTIAGAVTVPVGLAPGESRTVRFGVAWYFPVPDRVALSFLTDIATLRRHYAARFDSAAAVAGHLAGELDRLERATRAWVATWYTDSSLPHWLLERTHATAATLATSTCLRFTNGRFYAWEGVDCCAGTCEHVWNYAEAVARLFGDLERDTRERVDLGIGFHPDTGEIGNRAEADMNWATDGQCGTILRIYREHQLSADDAFLRRVWPRVRQALGWVMGQDTRGDATLEGPQPNTLDAVWYGEVAWMTGMYDAALHAGAAMADDLGDTAFAARCRALAEAGAASLSTDLWTGEYFVQRVDPNHPEAPNSNIGCHIDQLFGQSLAEQLGLPRVFDADRTATALRNVFRYNFVPDPAAYRAANTAIPGGRWFAMAGEPAMIMTTFPHGGAAQANGTPPQGQAAYFNESWTGQEMQFAAHLVYEGIVDEGLTVARAVHERYAAAKRNPYNEIECSENYARAMSGYAVFLAACGFSCHGPRGRLAFAPRIGADDFAAAFTAAGGWGLYRQRRHAGRQVSTVEVRHGRVRVAVLALDVPGDGDARVDVRVDGTAVAATASRHGTTVEVTLADPAVLHEGQALTATVGARAL